MSNFIHERHTLGQFQLKEAYNFNNKKLICKLVLDLLITVSLKESLHSNSS